MSITDTASRDDENDAPAGDVDPRRAAYTAGLRKLADLLDKHHTIPLPYHGRAPYPFGLSIYGVQDRDTLTVFAAEVDNPTEKQDEGSYRVIGKLDGLHVDASGPVANFGREVVRERPGFEVEPILTAEVTA